MPYAVALGVELESASAQQALGHLSRAPQRCTAGGTLHGGALMGLADSIGAVCAYLVLPTGPAPPRPAPPPTCSAQSATAGSPPPPTRCNSMASKPLLFRCTPSTTRRWPSPGLPGSQRRKGSSTEKSAERRDDAVRIRQLTIGLRNIRKRLLTLDSHPRRCRLLLGSSVAGSASWAQRPSRTARSPSRSWSRTSSGSL